MAAYAQLSSPRPKTTHPKSRQRSNSGFDDYLKNSARRPETSYDTHPKLPPQKRDSQSRKKTARPATSHHSNYRPPHSSKNVNVNHHTACLVTFDDQPLTFNVEPSLSRRSDVYDVPGALQNILKLDEGFISKGLKKRLCSAARVYCGNNILNLHKRTHERSVPGSSRYKWAPTKSTMLLPRIVGGSARPRTAGSARNRHSEPEGGCPRPSANLENTSGEPDNRNITDKKEMDNEDHKEKENDCQTKGNARDKAISDVSSNKKDKDNSSVSEKSAHVFDSSSRRSSSQGGGTSSSSSSYGSSGS